MIITSEILTTISNGGNVWLMGDTHLLKKEKDRPRIVINKNYETYQKEIKKSVRTTCSFLWVIS